MTEAGHAIEMAIGAVRDGGVIGRVRAPRLGDDPDRQRRCVRVVHQQGTRRAGAVWWSPRARGVDHQGRLVLTDSGPDANG